MLIPLRNEFGLICCLAINRWGDEEGDSSRWARLVLPPLPRWQEEKMGWSGVRLTTSLQLSTKIHRAECVHAHQSLLWVNSRLKRMVIFQTVYLRTKNQSSDGRGLAELLWVSNKVRFGHFLPNQSEEGCEDDSDTHPQQAEGCHALHALLFTALLWFGAETASATGRNQECLIPEHHTVCLVLTLDSAAPVTDSQKMMISPMIIY